MTWRKFAAGAPDMAEFGRREFERWRVAVVGTICRDGSPRISHVEPCILEEELYLGMLWHSRKALDLQHDPRIVLRNAVCSSTGDECELTLRGRAVEVHRPEIRQRYQAAVDSSKWCSCKPPVEAPCSARTASRREQISLRPRRLT